MSEMKLNFTRDEVYADYEDAPELYTQKLQHDWLAMYADLTSLRDNLKEAWNDITMIAKYNSGTGIHQYEPINDAVYERIKGILRSHNLIEEE